LFVLVSVLCVWLGLWASRAQRQKRAVAWIASQGGSVHYDFEYARPAEPDPSSVEVDGYQWIDPVHSDGEPIVPELPAPKWLCDWIGIDFFADVVAVSFNHPLGESERPPLADLPRLRYLTMVVGPGTDISNVVDLPELQSLAIWVSTESRAGQLSLANLETIGRLTSLRDLTLCGRLSPGDLRYVGRLTSLERLTINSQEVAEAGLEDLDGLVNLRRLTLAPDVTDACLARLRGLQRLESLAVSGRQLTEVGVAHLARFPALREFEACARISPPGLEMLQRMPRLERALLSSHRKTESGLRKLNTARPKLRVIDADFQ